jgi:hypothetical protein
MQGPATRRRVGVDVAQVLKIDETDEIDDETDETDDETDEIDDETDETDEVDVSSVQREPAAGNVTQRGAERLKNSRELARSKNEFYLNPLESLPSSPGGLAGAADVAADVVVVLATTSSSLIFFHIHLFFNVLEKISRRKREQKTCARPLCREVACNCCHLPGEMLNLTAKASNRARIG